MSATPKQKGTPLIASVDPTFDKYIVVKGTWKENPNGNIITTETGPGVTNLMEGDPGCDASCDLVLKKGATTPDDAPLLQQLDLLTELTGSNGQAARRWVVMEKPALASVEGSPVKQSVKLLFKEYLDSVIDDEE